ncbi:MAG: amidohydrolase family protein [Mucilaginibacter sp.]
MLKIDTHQHFWQFDPVRDSWITEEMAVIQRDFMPQDLHEVLLSNEITGCIAVQAPQSEEENTFLLDLAKENAFIKGIVGWVDLQADNLESRLQYYQQYDKMKGFRHILQAEPDDQFMLNEKFKRGISLLNKYGFTYDLLIGPKHLKYANQLVRAFPEQRFVIDHMAKPFIKIQEIKQWEDDIKAIAKHQHVYCKVSGFCTEADWNNWTLDDIKPFLDVIFQSFGSNRVMYGSDWPVCNLAGGYRRSLQCVEEYVSAFSIADQALFWGKNAVSFYRLDDLIK